MVVIRGKLDILLPLGMQCTTLFVLCIPNGTLLVVQLDRQCDLTRRSRDKIYPTEFKQIVFVPFRSFNTRADFQLNCILYRADHSSAENSLVLGISSPYHCFKTKFGNPLALANGVSLSHIFPGLASAACIYFML